MKMKEAYAKLIARHFDAEWSISDKEFSLEMFYYLIYSCMAKTIAFHIIRHYENNTRNWYGGYRHLWTEHRFLCPDLFYESVITFREKPVLSRIRWMLKISSSYAEKMGGVRCDKAGAKLRIQTIEYYTR